MIFGDYEPLISDVRLAPIDSRLREQLPELGDDTAFVTWLQPEGPHPRDPNVLVPSQAVFGVVSPDPKGRPFFIVTTSTTSLRDWKSADEEYRHYVGKADPAYVLLKLAALEQATKLTNMRALIN